MSNGILSTYLYVTRTLEAKGDSQLGPGDDPFTYNQHYGAYIEARSNPGHHLTWSFLKTAVEGLYMMVYLRGKYKTATFIIWDQSFGAVGTGKLKADLSLSNATLALAGNVTLKGTVGATLGVTTLTDSR